jgi:NDP-sugar pyrophosphorylase family protein
MSYKVVIPTAGIGSRLGSETQSLNKSLITLGNKPIISRIIEKFPANCEFIILIGFKGELVRDYIKIAHGNLNLTFIKVKNFSGKGSGLGLSLSKAKKKLNKPFVFASCDTIVSEKIPSPNTNWLGYSSDKRMLKSYRTISLKNKKFVNNFYEKGKLSKNIFPYIGLAGFKDPELFWSILKNASQKDFLKGESYCIDQLLKVKKFKAYKFKWMDTGNIKKLNIYKKNFLINNCYNILEKKDEAIWFIKDKVIKFSLDKNFIKKRFNRSVYIKKFIPKLLSKYKNFYSYKKENGSTVSSVINLRIFKKLMSHCERFWKIDQKINYKKKKTYLNFYKHKTFSRIEKFYQENDVTDKIEIINNIETPKLSSMLKKIDWKNLSRGIPTTFHGDLHFENILINKKKKFIFLDWRQDFQNSIKKGDLYYELGKLLHGMIVSHEEVFKDNFKIVRNSKKIKFFIKTKKEVISCRNYLYQWARNKKLDINKINLITSLIFLNIAPLHHVPYRFFLYYLGKYLLCLSLKQRNIGLYEKA